MRKFALPAVVVLLATLVPATPAAAIDEVNTKRLRDAVTVNGILSHQRVLQRIANTNGGTRASGTPGYAASAVKAANAADAGYHAVIIFNEGQPGRQEFFTGTLGGPGELPVVGLSFAGGQALYLQTRSADVVVRVVTSTEVTEDAPTSNVLARHAGWRPGQGDRGRRPPGLGGRRPGHQRQRQRHRGHPGDRRADVQAGHQPAAEGALRILGRGGAACWVPSTTSRTSATPTWPRSTPT